MSAWAGLLASIALPWIAGAATVVALRGAAGRHELPLAAGYGFLIGVLAATLVLRAASFAGSPWHPMLLDAAMVAIATIAGTVAFRARASAPAGDPVAGSLAGETAPYRWLFAAALALLAVRILGLAIEVAVSPLRAYDAWGHWSTKARVWLEAGRLVPFVSGGTWLAQGDPGLYTDSNPSHPGTLPLLQVWVARHTGGWNEPMVNAPWLAMVVAFALAFYAQARAAGARASLAMVATWLVVSMPVLGQHVAQSGAADLFMGAAYAMAAMAVWRWSVTREPGMALVAALSVAAGAWIKIEGRLWMATLAPPVRVALHRRAGLILVGAAVAAFAAYLALGPERLPMLGYVLRNRPVNVLPTLILQVYTLDHWHLAAYAFVAVAAWRWRVLLAPRHAPATLTVFCALGLVVVVFFFSSAAFGVADETLGNRFILHLMPTLVFYTLVLLLDPGAPAGDQPSAQATKAADA